MNTNDMQAWWDAIDPDQHEETELEKLTEKQRQKALQEREQKIAERRAEKKRKVLNGAKRFEARRARKLAAKPRVWSVADIRRARMFWGAECAYCGKDWFARANGSITPGFDHYIPLDAPGCPGTVIENMLPCCRECNHAKGNQPPGLFLALTRSKEEAQRIQARIETYFASVKPRQNTVDNLK